MEVTVPMQWPMAVSTQQPPRGYYVVDVDETDEEEDGDVSEQACQSLRAMRNTRPERALSMHANGVSGAWWQVLSKNGHGGAALLWPA